MFSLFDLVELINVVVLGYLADCASW